MSLSLPYLRILCTKKPLLDNLGERNVSIFRSNISQNDSILSAFCQWFGSTAVNILSEVKLPEAWGLFEICQNKVGFRCLVCWV